MPFLIDGHNLIGQTPGLSLADPDDEQQLVALLRKYLARVKKKGTVVFDPGPGGERRQWSNATLAVKFAAPGQTADAVIQARVWQDQNPRGLTVVTADRALADMVKRRGAEVLDSATFAAAMLASPPLVEAKKNGLSAAEVAEWEALFKKKRRD